MLKEYTAFPEEWVSATWTNGGLAVHYATGDVYYTYADGIPFTVLDITNGTATNYGMIQGRDYQVYLHKDGAAVKEIYIVVGELAGVATADHTATQVKDNATYTYLVRDNLITSYTTDVFQTSAPSIVLEGTENTPVWTNNNNDTYTAEIPYAVWKNWIGKDYVVSPAVGNEIAVNNRVSFGTADVKVGVTANEAGKDQDQTQEIVVYAQSLTPDTSYTGTKAYTFTVVYKAAGNDASLKISDTTTYPNAMISEGKIGFVGNGKVEYSVLKQVFVPNDVNATAVWSYTDGTGNTVSGDAIPADADTASGTWKVTVTAENGTVQATYTLTTVAEVVEKVDGVAKKTANVFVGDNYTPVTSQYNAGARQINGNTAINFWTVSVSTTNWAGQTLEFTPAVVVEDGQGATVAMSMKITSNSSIMSASYTASTSPSNCTASVANAVRNAQDNKVLDFDLTLSSVTSGASVAITFTAD